MSNPTVYLETTVIGHLIGRIHSDPLVAGKQIATRKWWDEASSRFQVFVSELVANECAAGDTEAATKRLELLAELQHLTASLQAELLAQQLIASHAIPSTEPRDAVHISLAAVHGIEYLLTWNFKHIANPSTRNNIESTCEMAGFRPPIICTPEALMEA
ncbi:MAG: type II toxin-antitoxin system VapC family toxin [Planctomycetota bacterium]